MLRSLSKITLKSVSLSKGSIHSAVQRVSLSVCWCQSNHSLNRFFTRLPESSSGQQSPNKNVSDVMKNISCIDSSLSLQRFADSLFSNNSMVSSSIMVQLLKKTGDLRINSMLSLLYLRYYQLYGYSDIVTNELIDQYCRYYNIEAIAQLYQKLRLDGVLFSKASYEKLLLSLLRCIQYKQVGLNITKEMTKQGYSISYEALMKVLSLPGVCDAEIFISVLSLVDPHQIPLNKIPSILGKRLIAFSRSYREVSVLETYRSLAITVPADKRSQYTRYLEQAFKYYFQRNLCITYNNKDPVLMTAFTQALLEVHYTKKESISEFIQLLTDANRIYDINLGRFFSYYARIGSKGVSMEEWKKLRQSGIHMDLPEVLLTGKELVQIKNPDITRGFLLFTEDLLTKACETELLRSLRSVASITQKVPLQSLLSLEEWLKKGVGLTEEIKSQIESASDEKRKEWIGVCYHSILCTNITIPERMKNLQASLFQLIHSVSSFSILQEIVKNCLDVKRPYTLLEAKQFCLSLLHFNRDEDAKQMYTFLNKTYNITSPFIVKELMQRGNSL